MLEEILRQDCCLYEGMSRVLIHKLATNNATYLQSNIDDQEAYEVWQYVVHMIAWKSCPIAV